MRTIAIIISLLFIAASGYCQHTPVSFYVVAEQDQWQLFMGTNAWNDIATTGPGSKRVVLIYVTAGDESCNGTLNVPFYHARQEGANLSAEFCADENLPHDPWHDTTVTVDGHIIHKYVYRNVTSYCMRLPGGCSGGGLHGESLKYLHNGTVSSITPVDSTAAYNSWNNLTKALHDIVVKEVPDTNAITFHTADTSMAFNPGDRPDHYYTAHLLIDAIRNFDNYTINLYREYSIATLPHNLNPQEIANKAALLSQLDFGRTSNGQPSEWTPAAIEFTSRNYFRTFIKHLH